MHGEWRVARKPDYGCGQPNTTVGGMRMMSDSEQLLTLGEVSLRIGRGLLPWHMDRLCSRAAVPFQRAGRMRLIRAGDLDAVREAARTAGYLREQRAETATA